MNEKTEIYSDSVDVVQMSGVRLFRAVGPLSMIV